MHRIVAVLRGAVVVASLGGVGLAAAGPAAAQSPEPGRTYRIGFSQLVDHPALNATRQGFVDGLKSPDSRSARTSCSTTRMRKVTSAPPQHRGKFLAGGVDMLAPCTTPVVLATIRVAKDSKTPVVFGCVTNPVQAGVLQSADKPTGTNVTGFYTVPPVGRNLDMFLAIKPGIKTIGTIYNSGETNSETLNKLAKAEAEKRGIGWVAATITSSAEVKNAADPIGRVDAIITLQDNTVASAYEAVIRAARDGKVRGLRSTSCGGTRRDCRPRPAPVPERSRLGAQGRGPGARGESAWHHRRGRGGGVRDPRQCRRRQIRRADRPCVHDRASDQGLRAITDASLPRSAARRGQASRHRARGVALARACRGDPGVAGGK
jgi:putative ABC transport system substrate-binding protein